MWHAIRNWEGESSVCAQDSEGGDLLNIECQDECIITRSMIVVIHHNIVGIMR